MLSTPNKDYSIARSKALRQVLLSKIKQEDPYVSVLEEELENFNKIKKDKVPYFEGFVTTKSILGVFDSGRKQCFSKNFMPLLKWGEGDFASKWSHVSKNIPYWLESGNKIELYEFMHDLYVAEGNKRVSVAKYKNIPFIDSKITRIVPNLESNKTESVRLYYEFLEFEKRTNISSVWFSKQNLFPELEEYIDYYYGSNQDKYNQFLKEVFHPFKYSFNQLSKRQDFKIIGETFMTYLQDFDLSKKDSYKTKDYFKLTKNALKETKEDLF